MQLISNQNEPVAREALRNCIEFSHLTPVLAVYSILFIHSFIHSADVTGVLLDVKKFSNLEEYIMNKLDESFSCMEFTV